MVFPLMEMDGKRRRKYALIASIVHGVCVLCTTVCALYSSTIAIAFMQGLAQLMLYRNVVGYIPIAIAVLFFFTACLHLHGVLALAEQRHPVTRWMPNSISEIKFAFVISLLCALFAAAASAFYFVNLDTNLSHGIIQGMLGYTINATDKRRINFMQRSYECCAINSFKDWWENSDFKLHGAEKEFDLKNLSWPHCSNDGCYVPHTCCKLDEMLCSPRVLLSNITRNSLVSENRANEWFYSKGCLEAVKDKFCIVCFVALCSLCVVLDIICLVYTNIVSSSFYVLGITGADEDELLPAWILPFPGPRPQEIIKQIGEEQPARTPAASAGAPSPVVAQAPAEGTTRGAAQPGVPPGEPQAGVPPAGAPAANPPGDAQAGLSPGNVQPGMQGNVQPGMQPGTQGIMQPGVEVNMQPGIPGTT